MQIHFNLTLFLDYFLFNLYLLATQQKLKKIILLKLTVPTLTSLGKGLHLFIRSFGRWLLGW